MIDYYVVFVVVVDLVVFVVDVAAAEFDDVISADIAVVVFHLVVAVLVLFVVATVVSDFEIDKADSTVAWDFLEVIVDYFGETDEVVTPAVCTLHLRVFVDLGISQ